MFAIDYRFHVLPRHREAFVFAYRSAQSSLCQMLGLESHELVGGEHGSFTLKLAWDARASFDRFTRTWLGVWLINGMGLERDALSAPTETRSTSGDDCAVP